MVELGEDRPMTREECARMWNHVYRAESARFERERDEARIRVVELEAALRGVAEMNLHEVETYARDVARAALKGNHADD